MLFAKWYIQSLNTVTEVSNEMGIEVAIMVSFIGKLPIQRISREKSTSREGLRDSIPPVFRSHLLARKQKIPVPCLLWSELIEDNRNKPLPIVQARIRLSTLLRTGNSSFEPLRKKTVVLDRVRDWEELFTFTCLSMVQGKEGDRDLSSTVPSKPKA